MKLRTKVYIASGATIVVFIILTYLIARMIVLDSFARLEDKSARKSVDRVVNVFNDRLSSLATTAKDYSTWDDTYDYVIDHNDDYVNNNLMLDTFSSLNVDVIVIMDADGNQVISRAYDLVKKSETSVPPDLLTQLGITNALYARLSVSNSASGIIKTEYGPMLIGTHAIMTSLDSGPRHGTFLMGRYLGDAEIRLLELLTQQTLGFYWLDQTPDDMTPAVLRVLRGGQNDAVQPLDAQRIAGYHLLSDFTGDPAMVVRVLIDREMYVEGQSTLYFFMAAIVVTSLVFAAILLIMIEKLVVARVGKLSNAVKVIAHTSDFTGRVKDGNADELGALADNINHMLDALAEAHKMQLAHDKRYRSLIENSGDAIVVVDQNAIVQYESPAVTHILGFTVAERLGQKAFSQVHPDDMEQWRLFADRVFSVPQVTMFIKLRLRHKDGSWRHVDGSAINLLDDPAVNGIVLNYHDTTSIKRVEESLRNSERKYHSVIQQSVEGIFLVDDQGQVVEWNQAMATLTQLRWENVANRYIWDIFIDLKIQNSGVHIKRERLTKGVRRVLVADGTGERTLQWEGSIERADGRVCIIKTVFFVVDTVDSFMGVAICQDITEMRQQESALRNAYESTLEGWVRAIDLRDDITGGHSRRVTQLTVQLAGALGIPADKIDHIRRGAMLHDIGKIGVPDHVLHKPGPLNEEEWAIMRRHPSLAMELLQPIEHLRPAIEIPFSHHERWDGTGYPLGLTGEEIPLAARIFAVVDIWDALQSRRPYREAIAAPETREYLRSIAGTHLDPKIVDVFLDMVAKTGEPTSG